MKTGKLVSTCDYCGCYTFGANGETVHTEKNCPAIDEIEYFADGRIKRIVKRKPAAFVPSTFTGYHFDCVPPSTFTVAPQPPTHYPTFCNAGFPPEH
jgi:hypothetical protein